METLQEKVGVVLLTSGWKPTGWGTSKVLNQLPVECISNDGGPQAMQAFLTYIVNEFENLPKIIATCDCLHRRTDGDLMPIFENSLHKFRPINETFGGRNPEGWDTEFDGFQALLEDREFDFTAVGPKAVRSGVSSSAFDIDYSNRPFIAAWKSLYPDHNPPEGAKSPLSWPQANAYKISKTHLQKVGKDRLKKLLDWSKRPGSSEMHLLPFMFNATLRYCALETPEDKVSEEPEKSPESPPEEQNQDDTETNVDIDF